MPPQCKKCKQFMSSAKPEDTFKCSGECGDTYHKNKKCLKSYTKCISTGLCDDCLEKKTKKGTPMSTKASGQQKTPTETVRQEPFLSLDPSSVTIEALLAELNSKMAVVFEIKSNTDFYAESYDEMVKLQKETNDLIKTQAKKINDLQNRCQHLETVNSALEMRVHAIEQEDKNRNLEITGLENRPNESIPVLVNTIASKLEVNPGDLDNVERAWRHNKGKKTSENNKCPPLIIRFRTTTAKEEWYNRRNRIRKNSDVFSDGSSTPVYINENLTNHNKELLWNAKQKLKATFKFIWVKYGRVLCRKDENSRVIPLYSTMDIEKLISSTRTGEQCTLIKEQN